MNIRFAEHDDADKFVSLIRNSFNADILNTMIYDCNGIQRFLEEQLSIPCSLTDTIYIIGEKNSELVGCVEFREIKDLIFLNYICTLNGYRHNGLGKILLKEALSMVRKSYHKRICLDVFCENITAKTWYEKLGFTTDYLTSWWHIPLPTVEINSTGNITGYAQAQICHENFGFSQLNITTSKGAYSVGRLGNNWYRVSQVTLLNDMEALSCLYRLDPKRAILGLFHDDELEFSQDAVLLRKSARLSSGFDSLYKTMLNEF